MGSNDKVTSLKIIVSQDPFKFGCIYDNVILRTINSTVSP